MRDCMKCSHSISFGGAFEAQASSALLRHNDAGQEAAEEELNA